MAANKKSAEVLETKADPSQKEQSTTKTTQKENTMEKPKIPDLKTMLSQVVIKPGEIPQIKYTVKASVVKASTRVPANTFFRAHREYEHTFMMIPSGKGMDSKMLIIGPEVVLPSHLSDSIIPICCHLIVFPDGELQILERKTAMPGEPLNEYQQSSLNVVKAAKSNWVMRRWNAKSGIYDYIEADATYAPDPVWPEEDFMDLLCKAYEGRIIDSHTHPVYLELAGIKAAEND